MVAIAERIEEAVELPELTTPFLVSPDVAAVLACRIVLKSHDPEKDAEAFDRLARGMRSPAAAQVYFDAAAFIRDQIAIRNHVDRIFLNVNCVELERVA